MKIISTFHAFILTLAIALEISEAYVCKECEVGPQVLEYFHPPHRRKDDVGVCKDPCKMNRKFTDPVKIEAARNAVYQCSKVDISCKNKTQSKYRSIDGSCNNIKKPSWGMSVMCQRILLPHDYSDGVSSPRKSCLGRDLPPARVISNALHRETQIIEGNQTLHFMEWGQTIAHDITNTPLIEGIKPKSCCDSYPKQNDNCIVEEVPPDDPFYLGKMTCIPFLRTIPCPLCNGSTREVINEFTSHFDLSVIYGNNEDIAKKLRRYVDGMLDIQYVPDVGPLPPPELHDQIGGCEALNSTRQCFLAGDDRIAQNPFITVNHIVFLRYHNNVCRKLKLLNSHWDDETLYQEARRILIAQAQYLTFAEYLPLVLGPHLMSQFKLEVLSGSKRTKYNSQIDATTFGEVTAAAHRYGHSFVPNSAKTEDPESRKNSTIYVKDYFYYPFDYYDGLLDRLALGMTKDRARTHNLFYASSIRNYLFHKRNEGEFVGTDLAATTIIRGREHGIPGYSYYLKEIFNHNVYSFCDLRRFIPPENIRRFRKIYKSVYDIDLYTGGLAEYKVKGSMLGPTFTSLIVIQMQRIKFGDRYYFEHGNQAGSFTNAQLLQIKETYLSKIICETTKISKVQVNVFHLPSKQNPVKACKSIPDLDLSPWRENKRSKNRKTEVPSMPYSMFWSPYNF